MGEKIYDIELSEQEITKKSKVKPIKAIKEAIWNACDADATQISINLNKNEFESIETIEIIDNGHGINFDNVDSTLKSLGKSEKTTRFKSPKGRCYHGKYGEGRYTYFALGSFINWKSIFCSGKSTKEFSIKFDKSKIKQIFISGVSDSDEKPGLKVTITNIVPKIKLEKDSIITEFASYLLAHEDINIFYDGEKLDLKKYIYKQNEFRSTIKNESNIDINITVKIIKWDKINTNQMFLCGIEGNVYREEKLKQIPQNLNGISVYIRSDYFDTLNINGTLDFHDILTEKIEEYAHNCVLEFNKSSDTEILEKIRNYEAYPFNNVSDTKEQVQQKMFDLLALEIEKQKFGKNIKDRKLTYKLIAQALNDNPTSLSKIILEVINLSKEKQNEFSELLCRTTLNNMITTMSDVANRLTFLDLLNRIVYCGDNVTQYMKERIEFQPLLLQELWIFGDMYKYGTDDISFKNLIKKYSQQHFGHEIELTDEQKNCKDYNKIPDICLWNRQRLDSITYENLLVEIKRPNKILGEKELSQIKNYAYTVVKDPTLSHSRWHFILIGNDYDDFIREELKSDSIIQQKDNYKISVLKWSELIESNKLRYQYFQDNAKIVIDNSQIASQLEKKLNSL